LGEALSAHLQARGETVVEATWAPCGTCRVVDPANPLAFDALLQAVAACGVRVRGIVHLWSLDIPSALTVESLQAAQVLGCGSVLHLVQALSGTPWRDPPRLWLVTRGTQAAGACPVAAPAQAPLWGLGRTLALEHPHLGCTRLDLGPEHDAQEADDVLRELWAAVREDEVALRPDGRRVARLRRGRPCGVSGDRVLVPAGSRPFRLEIERPGALDRLFFQAISEPTPRAGEVTLAVQAVGLNFKDVLTALGAVPPPPDGIALGLECVGRIRAVGEGVVGLAVGQSVLALAAGCLSSIVTVPAALVVPLPPHLAPEEAATLPVAHVTAYHALAQVARLSRGERVLIHAATGGVGQAALQWARHVGAEIHATAGTPEKRDLLRALGVEHVSDSRSPRFVDDILDWTQGEGVDVVLNSLSGAFLEQSLGLLRDHGRFVELGQRDGFSGAGLALEPFLRNLSFSLVDLAGMVRKRPLQVRRLLEEVLEWVAQGVLAPIPHTVMPMSRVQEAFRMMAQGRHTGKLVMTPDEAAVRVAVSAAEGSGLRSDGTYLVTGGLGGLGLSAARWLAVRGARHLVLVSRRGLVGPEQTAAMAEMEAAGARVSVVRTDVSDAAAMAAMLDDLRERMPPLRGVIHAAGVLDDGLLLQQDLPRLKAVAAPKILGAWNLHALTLDAPLDFFVMYSSTASLLGAAGQGNYAAANAFLDALAHLRHAMGRPALSINWGPFARVGLAAARSDRGERLRDRGMASLTPDQGLDILGRLLGCESPQVGVVSLNARQWVEFHPHLAGSSLWSGLASPPGSPPAAAAAPFRDSLSRATPAERPLLLQRFIRDQLAGVLGLDSERIDPTTPFQRLGVDSLMGLELRNRLEAALGLTLPATLLWSFVDTAGLSSHLRKALNLDVCAPGAATAAEVATETGPGTQDQAALGIEAALSDLEAYL